MGHQCSLTGGPVFGVHYTGHLEGMKAGTTCQGHELRFWTKIVAVYPDNLVRDLIAHELAHVCQAAEGEPLGTANPQDLEEDADMRVASWGFDTAAMDEWDWTKSKSR